MRTNIMIDDDLMAEALEASGAATKRQVVEDALKALIRARRQQGILALRGKINWVGDLDEMRRD